MEYVTLNNGITMPQLGFGVYQIKDPTECNVFFQQHAAQAYLAKRRVAMESWAPFAEGKNNLFEKSILKEIGNTHHKSVAQVVLRWELQRGIICIPKSTHKQRMQENFEVFDFELSDDEMKQIATLDTHTSCFFNHLDPKTVEQLTSLVRNV